MNGFRPLRKNFATTSYPFRIRTSEKFTSKNFRCFDPKTAKFSVVLMRNGSVEVEIRAFSQSIIKRDRRDQAPAAPECVTLAFLTLLCGDCDLSVLSTRVKKSVWRWLVEGDELDGSKSSGRTEEAIFRSRPYVLESIDSNNPLVPLSKMSRR